MITTAWSWPSSTASRVYSMNAATSEPTNISPSPTPSTSGVERRAATIVPGSSALANTSVKWPSRRRSTASTEATKSPAVSPCAYWRATRCTATSVSVSLANSTPAASSSRRSAAKFSMIPLWTTAILTAASLCGWALRSVGRPWVAQRVWPTPECPLSAAGSVASSAASRLASRPARRRTVRVPRPLTSGDTGGVVAPVLHPAQCIDHHIAGGTVPDVADDSAHSAHSTAAAAGQGQIYPNLREPCVNSCYSINVWRAVQYDRSASARLTSVARSTSQQD